MQIQHLSITSAAPRWNVPSPRPSSTAGETRAPLNASEAVSTPDLDPAVPVAEAVEAPPAQFSEVLRETLADSADRFQAFIERLSASAIAQAPRDEVVTQDQPSEQESASQTEAESAIASYTSFQSENSHGLSGAGLNIAS